ncbi:MAG: hypothetical protein FJ126_08170 [Deltaproteobacteria bacterium]|nr:hypothetical protein [Deltaproteobacteria bacterium]
MSKKKISAINYVEAIVYFEPMRGDFNLHPFINGFASDNNADTTEIINRYLERYKDAWEKLAER